MAEQEKAILIILAAIVLIVLVVIVKKQANLRALEKRLQERQSKLETESIETILSKLDKGIKEINDKINAGNVHFGKLNSELSKLKNIEKKISVGLIPATFSFNDSEKLKAAIRAIRDKQYACIAAGNATTSYANWEWFGSKSKGSEMVKAYNSLLLQAFNAEFEFIRKQMRVSTFDVALDKLDRLEDQLEKLGETVNVEVSYDYRALKCQELEIWHEELQRKEDLKELHKEQREMMREEREMNEYDEDEELDELEVELAYQQQDLQRARKLAEEKHGENKASLELEIQKIHAEIERLQAKFERAQSQAQITKAGYIYVISNIGSFGEGVVKIGMTRRLEPMDRVNELGDASVPFKFDVHTLAFVKNAPTIEKALHKKFHKFRVNPDNTRREFFRVTPEEVKQAMEEMNIESDWYFDIEAKEYRESLLIAEARRQQKLSSLLTSDLLPEEI